VPLDTSRKWVRCPFCDLRVPVQRRPAGPAPAAPDPEPPAATDPEPDSVTDDFDDADDPPARGSIIHKRQWVVLAAAVAAACLAAEDGAVLPHP
jgi:hypothetical protein